MLQKVTHIEGLSAFEDVELANDTDPTATQITFEVRSEVMPFLSDQKGEVSRQNFVWITKVINLGNTIVMRRIKDKVEYDEANGRWKVLKLAPVSDIKQYPDAWNAFALSTKPSELGTPLETLFRHDPTRAEMYKLKHVFTVEQLAALTDGNLEQIGMGARSDRDRARKFVAVAKEHAESSAVNNKLDEKEKQIASLQNQLADVTAKLSMLLEAQLGDELSAPKKTKGRAKKAEFDEGPVAA